MLLPRVPLYSARAVTATSEPVSQAQLPSEIPDDVGCGSAHSADDAGSGGHNGPAGHTAQHRAKVTAFHLQQLALELTARDRAIGAPKHANAGRRGFRRPA
jgi:hypothetical protein